MEENEFFFHSDIDQTKEYVRFTKLNWIENGYELQYVESLLYPSFTHKHFESVSIFRVQNPLLLNIMQLS